MKKMSLFSVIVLVLIAMISFLEIVVPKESTVIIKNVIIEKEIFSLYNNFEFRGLALVDGFLAYQEINNINPILIQDGTIPTFSYTVSYPMVISDYETDTLYTHNVNYLISLEERENIISLSFYGFGDKGTLIITLTNLKTKETMRKSMKITVKPNFTD